MSIKLMIKEHRDTGLKYLCMTRKEDHDSYPGSGTYWLSHLQKHGLNIQTTVIYETDDESEFKRVARHYSKIYDVTNSKDWANLRDEEGDGGDTVSNRRWITNGFEDKYIFKAEAIPEGWKPGRSRCVFNDPSKQKVFGALADLDKRGKRIKEAWIDRENNKFATRKTGIMGDKNPAKRPEVRKKISETKRKKHNNV